LFPDMDSMSMSGKITVFFKELKFKINL